MRKSVKKKLLPIIRGLKRHPKADPTCSCKGRGWEIFNRCGWGDERYREYDGMDAVQKCDECGVFASDEAVVGLAYAAGVECQNAYPCVLLRQPTVRCSLHVHFHTNRKGDRFLPKFITQAQMKLLGYKGATVRVVPSCVRG
jgi:hypothetical protein